MTIDEFIRATRTTSPFVSAENTLIGINQILLAEGITGPENPRMAYRPIFSVSRRTEAVEFDDKLFMIWDDGFNHVLCAIVELGLLAANQTIEPETPFGQKLARLYRILFTEAGIVRSDPGAMSVFGRFLLREHGVCAGVMPFPDRFFEHPRVSSILEAAQAFTLLHETGHMQHRRIAMFADVDTHFGELLQKALSEIQNIYSGNGMYLAETADDLRAIHRRMQSPQNGNINLLADEIRAVAGSILRADRTREEFVSDLYAIWRLRKMGYREGVYADSDLYPFRSEFSPTAILCAVHLVFNALSLIERVSDTLQYHGDAVVLERRLQRRRAIQVVRRDVIEIVLRNFMGWSGNEYASAAHVRNDFLDSWLANSALEELRIREDVLPRVVELSTRFAGAKDGYEWAASLRQDILQRMGYCGTDDEVELFKSGMTRWRRPRDKYIVVDGDGSKDFEPEA